MAIPYKVLTLILAELVRKGLLVAKQGPKGGYLLARSPTEITLLDIVEAAEGPATFDHCVLRDGPCYWEITCPVHDTWSQAQTALADHFGAATLAQLVIIDAALETDDHQPQTPSHSTSTPRHGKPIQPTPSA